MVAAVAMEPRRFATLQGSVVIAIIVAIDLTTAIACKTCLHQLSWSCGVPACVAPARVSKWYDIVGRQALPLGIQFSGVPACPQLFSGRRASSRARD